jgi:hypothetical protein
VELLSEDGAWIKAINGYWLPTFDQVFIHVHIPFSSLPERTQKTHTSQSTT